MNTELLIKMQIIEILKLTKNEYEDLEKDASLEKYGLDSLSAIELVVSLEKIFNINIDDEDLLMENLNTLDNLKKLIEKYK